MCALPVGAPTITVDPIGGTVTIAGELNWIDQVQDGIVIAPGREITNYSLTFSLAGSPFDPNFTPPPSLPTGIEQVFGTANIQVGDPNNLPPFPGDTVDSATGLLAAIVEDPLGLLHGVPFQGFYFENVIDSYSLAGGSGDQRYTFIVAMNADYTQIEGIFVDLNVNQTIGTIGLTETYFLGVDQMDGPIVLRELALIPTELDDVLDFGGEVDPVIVDGLGGNDEIIGGTNNDALDGNIGEDIIRGGAGRDTISGGRDNDELEGDAGRDRLTGNAGSDTLRGGAGNDRLNGQNGADEISGDGGNDTLNGGKGGDLLDGGIGADRLIDGAGKDDLVGGAGADVFVLVSDTNKDTILDFEDGLDQMDLSDWGNNLTAADLTIRNTATGVRIAFDQHVLLVESQGGLLRSTDISDTDFV